jgi:hypothetical protein
VKINRIRSFIIELNLYLNVDSGFMKNNTSSSGSSGIAGLPSNDGFFGAEDPNEPDKSKNSKDDKFIDDNQNSYCFSKKSFSDSEMDLDVESSEPKVF